MPVHSSTLKPGALPQYGFGADINFSTLLADNRFLFRIYTPKERSPFCDDTDPYFLAPKFNEQYARSPVELKEHQHLIDIWQPLFSDVVKHMDWTTRASSPFVSTSFSFAWCIWDALRRFHQGVKKDVQVAIIDGSFLVDRAMTTVELLEKAPAGSRTGDFEKWYRFSQDSQSVLVYGSIPGTAVLASIPLLDILQHLPSYLLKPGYHALNRETPLTGIGWDFTDKNASYRRFCRNMANRFSGFSTEERLADTTAGSLGMGLALLRPWFHKTVDQDINEAVNTLTTLAYIIAQWPGKTWICEHPETYDLIRSMATTLGQELREKHGSQVKDEVSRLQGVVDELHGMVKEYEQKLTTLSKPRRVASVLRATSAPPPQTFDPSPLRIVTSKPTASHPRMQTPLTPPASPRSPVSIPSSSSSLTRRCSMSATITPMSQPAHNRTASMPILSPTLRISNSPAAQSDSSGHDFSSLAHLTVDNTQKRKSIALSPLLMQPQYSHTSSLSSDIAPETLPLPPSPSTGDSTSSDIPPETLPLPSSPIKDDGDSWTIILSQQNENNNDGDEDTEVDEFSDSSYSKIFSPGDNNDVLDDSDSLDGSPTLVMASLTLIKDTTEVQYIPPKHRSGIFAEPLEFNPSSLEIDEEKIFRRPPKMIKAAGYIVTGFLIGAIVTVTVGLLTPHRRMVIHLT